MADIKTCTLDYFPENILIDILSYLNIRELVRAGRVCKRWRRLVKDQRLWRAVDLTTWKGITLHLLWVLLRQYLGCGLRCLRLRGLLLSARAGKLLSESWLQALASKCPRLRRLSLFHADLRGLRSCSLLPRTIQVLELHGCELPPGFFTQPPPEGDEGETAASASVKTAEGDEGKLSKGQGSAASGIAIETLVLDNVPSFTDQHLQSLSSWEKLTRLELRDVIRVTAAGVRNCAPKEFVLKTPTGGLSRLRRLEMGNFGRPGSQMQMASLGLGVGWPGLEEVSLGGREVGPGLLCLRRLRDLHWLRLRGCPLSEMQVLRGCRILRGLKRLEFCEVDFQVHQRQPDREAGEWGGGAAEGEEEEEDRGPDRGPDREADVEDRDGGEGEEGEGHEHVAEPGGPYDETDPVPTIRRALAKLLPQCTLVFTGCKVTMRYD
ncbi:F-box/LRR-repeat protein 12 [Alosa pseudoharengus]|uniref:F-box/LRR-repeat protein 12 n=1 Tax=Alosa pseudoharengus TaxID=34774 RepID=UPI003F8BA815